MYSDHLIYMEVMITLYLMFLSYFYHFFLPLKFWYFNSRYLFSIFLIFSFLKKEFMLLMGKKLFGGFLIYITFFCFILQYNIFGMFPYLFPLTSELNFNLYFSLVFFLMYFFIGWLKMPNIMFGHLTPLGSPLVMSPILVIVETISMMVRPITLSIRLTANTVSGHLLLEILLKPSSESSVLLIKLMFYFILIPLMILEITVCFVQAFVISSLSALYLSELLNH